jgi:cell division protein FtsB
MTSVWYQLHRDARVRYLQKQVAELHEECEQLRHEIEQRDARIDDLERESLAAFVAGMRTRKADR